MELALPLTAGQSPAIGGKRLVANAAGETRARAEASTGWQQDDV